MIRKYLYFLLLLFFISYFLYGIDAEEYTIEFEPLIMNQIDDIYMHLANSIPDMLYYEIQNAPMHIYSEEEIIFLKKRYNENIREEYLIKLSKSIEEYNTYLFSSDYNKDEYISLGEKVETEQKLIDDLEDSDTFIHESSVPIKYIIDEPSLNIISSGKSKISDLVIKGSMEKLDEWIYLQIWIKNNILGTEDLIYESISSPDTILDLIPEITRNLKTIVLGRPWASISFELVPEDSNIFIMLDNELVVYQKFQFLYPGIYDIEIKTLGYIPQKFKIELGEYETKILPVSLEEEKRITISVQSFPSGADLYSGAIWVGKTPLLIKNPIIPSLLTFKLEGYNDSKIVYKDIDNRDIQIFLQSDIINTEKIISRKREIFYQSFSYFLLSIPISLVSYGISSDYGYAFNRELAASGNTSEADRLMNLSVSWYNVYLGGVFLNLTLFVNTLFDLVGYIKSNNRL